jgi:hypothetical protein
MGLLDSSWSSMLAGMTLSTAHLGDDRYVTTLRGRLADQAALMGVLNLVYDLGMLVILVECESGLQVAPGPNLGAPWPRD